MAEDIPKHEDVGFERQDLPGKDVLIFLVGLAVVCIAVSFLLRGMYHYLDAYERSHQTPPNPLTEPARTLPAPRTLAQQNAQTQSNIKQDFPEPRLEENERNELTDFRLQEEKALNSYAWIDQKAGVVRIPIERAMQLEVQRGLPVLPQNKAAAGKPGAAKGATP